MIARKIKSPPSLEGLGREADKGWGEGLVPVSHRNITPAEPLPQPWSASRPKPSRGGGEYVSPHT